MDSGNVYFAEHKNLVVLKFVGEIRYSMGNPKWLIGSLSSFLENLFEKKEFENVLLDLREATSIDSTNLGLMAGITKFTQAHFNEQPTILSSNPDINELLESVGFDQVFKICRDPELPSVTLGELPDAGESDKSMPQIMLDAHRDLIALNEKNQEMFKDVVEMMQAEVDQSE
jgi:anti-anti-sigma factor